jgi:hypothetical protein
VTDGDSAVIHIVPVVTAIHLRDVRALFLESRRGEPASPEGEVAP